MFAKYIIISMRPIQWTKNCLVFAGLIFSGGLMEFSQILLACQAFVIFCLGSGSIYMINDIVDRESDQHHPLKKKRPIASGALSPSFAVATAVVLMGASLTFSFVSLPKGFFDVYCAYLGLMILYIFVFKNVIILDILTVGIGFVLRAVAGTVVLNVEISPWLIVCTFLLSLLLLIGKRRHELLLLRTKAYAHRNVLQEYSLKYIDQLMAVVTSSTVVTYALYTISTQTIVRLGTDRMPLTIPFVVYGIFRYLYLTHQRNLGGSPETLFISDRSLLMNIFLWALTTIILIYR